MQRNPFIECLLVVQMLLLFFISGCSRTEGTKTSAERALVAQAADTSRPDDIYDLLEDYPALNGFFTCGNLCRATFERKLFAELLGETVHADTLVALLDGLPPLFEARGVSEGVFAEDVQAEMCTKGPLPDLFAALAGLVGSILDLPPEQRAPVYAWLDALDAQENSHAETLESMDYLRELLFLAGANLCSFDKDLLNDARQRDIARQKGMDSPAEGRLDFIDLDDKLLDIAREAPEGLILLIEALRELLYDTSFREALAHLLERLGAFQGQSGLVEDTRAMLTDIQATYTAEALGDIIRRIWETGPQVGKLITEIGIEGYGRDGSIPWNLKEFLKHPVLFDSLLQRIWEFEQAGYSMSGVDTQIAAYTRHDPFVQPLDGAGEFGGGVFYEPALGFSYQHFSGVLGLIRYLTRWNVPIMLTSNMLYERPGAESTRALIRTLIPQADTLTITSSLWGDVYVKDLASPFGNGQPVREPTGYGMMVDGVFVAPLCPAVPTGADMALYLTADSVKHGPYDNIYDNMRWLLYERNFYATFDLVELVDYVPALKYLVKPLFELMGIEMLPLTIIHTKGAFPVVYAEIGSILQNLPGAIRHTTEQVGLPEWAIDLLVETMLQLVPVGYPAPGTGKTYFMPQDVRDLWTMVASLSYYDAAAFHADRFVDLENPENYTMFYDVSQYNYAENADKANPIFPLIAAVCVGMYEPYQEVVGDLPPTISGVSLRWEAARGAFGLIYPIGYVLNLLSPLAEVPTEAYSYDIPTREMMPLVHNISDLLAALEPSGLIDALLEVFCLLGSPERQGPRGKLLEALALIAGTVPPESTAPDTLAREILETPELAAADPRFWDVMELHMASRAALFAEDSPYTITPTLMALLEHLCGAELSDEQWSQAAAGLASLVGPLAEERFFARMRLDLSEINEHIDTTHVWHEVLELLLATLDPQGVLNYLLLGLERDTSFTWEEILVETQAFLSSETMMCVDEGSLWRDISHLVRFMAEAVE